MGGPPASYDTKHSYYRVTEAEQKLADDTIAVDIAKKLHPLNSSRRAYIRQRVQDILACTD